MHMKNASQIIFYKSNSQTQNGKHTKTPFDIPWNVQQIIAQILRCNGSHVIIQLERQSFLAFAVLSVFPKFVTLFVKLHWKSFLAGVHQQHQCEENNKQHLCRNNSTTLPSFPSMTFYGPGRLCNNKASLHHRLTLRCFNFFSDRTFIVMHKETAIQCESLRTSREAN